MTQSLPPSLRHVYHVIAAEQDVSADAALVTALPRLSEPFRTAAWETLLRRNRPGGLAALVGQFHHLGEDIQRLVLGRVDSFFEAVRLATASNQVETRLGAIALIRASDDARLSYLLADALPRRCARTSSAASSALVEKVNGFLERRGGAVDADSRRQIESQGRFIADALRRALETWQTHYRPEVLAAAMWLADLTEDALLGKGEPIRSTVARAMNDLVHRHLEPRDATYAVRALAHPQLRAAAAQAVSNATDSAAMFRLLDEMWVALDPRIAKSLGEVHGLAWLAERDAPLQSLTGRRAVAAAALVRLSSISVEQKVGMLRRMIYEGSADLGRAALWALTQLEAPQATQLLARLAGSDMAEMAAIASAELYRRQPDARLNVQRDLAPAQDPFEMLWERFDALPENLRLGDLHRLLETDMRFADRLRGKLASNDPAWRGRALQIVGLLRLESDFQERIYALTHDRDDRVRSQAVSMLARSDSATAIRILRQALNDPDHRVQANAIEVLDLLEAANVTEAIERKLVAENNRVRATAVKALIRHRVRDAAKCLVEMLGHRSPAYRASALWVVEQLQVSSLESRVGRLADHDPDESIRRRARQVMNSMAGWLGHASAEAGSGEADR